MKPSKCFHLQVALASVGGRSSAGSVSGGNSLTLELGENINGGAGEVTRVGERVGLASAADVGAAGGGVAGGGEELTLEGGALDCGGDTGEGVTLSKNVTTGADLEGVVRVVVPVVVDSVQVGIALDLRSTATGLVEVVTLHSNLVTGAVEVDVPVVVAIAGGRVVRLSVDVVVGEGDAVIGLSSEDVVLATNPSSLGRLSVILFLYTQILDIWEAYGHMVNPDKIGLVHSDGVTTPDVLRVDIGDCNVPGDGQYLLPIEV